MARATSPDSEDDRRPSKKGKPVNDVESEDEVEEGEGDDEEYEIEKILEAKRGVFPGGRIGYKVKWKGYPDSENSWVDENDIGGAQELVDEYWARNPAKKALLQGSSSARKKARQSTEPIDSSKKRGRKSAGRGQSDDEDMEPSANVPANKRAKKANGTATSVKSRSESPNASLAVGGVYSMPERYKHKSDWEPFIKSVDTVEMMDDGQLGVFFTLHDGTQVKEPSTVCKRKLPSKLIDFYEHHLRWKSIEEEA